MRSLRIYLVHWKGLWRRQVGDVSVLLRVPDRVWGPLNILFIRIKGFSNFTHSPPTSVEVHNVWHLPDIFPLLVHSLIRRHGEFTVRTRIAKISAVFPTS